jgi:hypothetical protein
MHLRSLTRRDWRWIADSDESLVNKSVWFCKTPFLNLAKLLGHYAGNRQNALPAWLAMCFSRDKTLQKL